MTVLTPARRELYSQIPESIRVGLVHFIVYTYDPGGFLTAVLDNDLGQAFGRADEDSVRGLRAIMTWLHSFAPSGAHGSPDKRKGWAERRVETNLQNAHGLLEGLEIFAALGDRVAADALSEIRSNMEA